jgi:hypothetical protein
MSLCRNNPAYATLCQHRFYGLQSWMESKLESDPTNEIVLLDDIDQLLNSVHGIRNWLLNKQVTPRFRRGDCNIQVQGRGIGYDHHLRLMG